MMKETHKSQKILINLKEMDLTKAQVFLAVVRIHKKERISQYRVKFVNLERHLENRLREILVRQISNSHTVEDYSNDCPEPEVDQVRSIDYQSTDFFRIFEDLNSLNPEEDVIEDVEQLFLAKAYMIILSTSDGIFLVGYKTLPENWKMRKSKNLITLLFKDNQFEDLEEENLFSISSVVDFFYFQETLFILSKKEFERGMNFIQGMRQKANEMYDTAENLKIFHNIEFLKLFVGTNQRYLRKISTIQNLGHYKDNAFMLKMSEVILAKGWNIQFNEGKIVFTDDTIDDILTLLQDKRLHSELTEKDYDVESATALEGV